jgi:hypothetical protein
MRDSVGCLEDFKPPDCTRGLTAALEVQNANINAAANLRGNVCARQISSSRFFASWQFSNARAGRGETKKGKKASGHQIVGH